MMKKIAYEMSYNYAIHEQSSISCEPFDKQFFQEYMRIYNECFYEMRKALDRKPYNVLESYEQIEKKTHDIYLLIEKGKIIGSVSCCNNEIDDLIVNKKYQQKGYGKQLLLFGMQQIRRKNNQPIKLHVAEWNQHAFNMYKKVGFEVTRIELIR